MLAFASISDVEPYEHVYTGYILFPSCTDIEWVTMNRKLFKWWGIHVSMKFNRQLMKMDRTRSPSPLTLIHRAMLSDTVHYTHWYTQLSFTILQNHLGATHSKSFILYIVYSLNLEQIWAKTTSMMTGN